MFPVSPGSARLGDVRQKLSFQGRIAQGDKQQGAYLYLPFEVPPRTTRIEVSYHYEKGTEDGGEGPANNIDIGIFDTRGIDLFTRGFRGWSGTARSSFFITPTEATPGYLPGPLQPGEWHLMLSRQLVVRPSCRYWVNVDLDVALEDADIEAAAIPLGPRPARGGAPPPAPAAGIAATSIPIPSTATATTLSRSWSRGPGSAAWSSWPSPTTTPSATTGR